MVKSMTRTEEDEALARLKRKYGLETYCQILGLMGLAQDRHRSIPFDNLIRWAEDAYSLKVANEGWDTAF